MATFGDEVKKVKHMCRSDEYLSFVLPVDCISGGGQSLMDFEKNPDIALLHPLHMVKLLFTLQYLIHESYLGLTEYTDTSGDDAGPRPTQKIQLKKVKPKCFFRAANATSGPHLPRVDEYVESIRSGNGDLRCLHFVAQVNDPGYTFETALLNHFSRTQKLINAKKFQPKPNTVQTIWNLEEWISVLNTYVDERFFKTALGDEVRATELTDSENPARFSKIFTFKHSQKIIAKLLHVKPEYRVCYLASKTVRAIAVAKLKKNEHANPLIGRKNYEKQMFLLTGKTADAISEASEEEDEYRTEEEEEGSYVDVQPVREEEEVVMHTEDGEEEEEEEDDRERLRRDRDNYERDEEGEAQLQSEIEMEDIAVTAQVEFPFGALYVPHEFRKPDIFFNISCFSYPEPSKYTEGQEDEEEDEDDENREETEEQRRAREEAEIVRKRMERLCLGDSLENGTSIDNAKAYFKVLKERCVRQAKEAEEEGEDVTWNELYFKELKSKESLQVMMSVIRNDEECPATVICGNYIQEQMDKNPGWSAIRPITHRIDSTLTTFGNFVAHDVLSLDHLLAMNVVHQEVFMQQLTTLGTFEMGFSLRMHTLFSGPPASGKSYIHETHIKLSIEALVESVSMFSKRAMTGNNNENGKQIYIDELSETFTTAGVDGTGMSEIKEVLTKGYLTSQMLHCDNDTNPPTRKMVKTVSKRKAQHLCGTNMAFWKLPEAIRTRFAKFYVPERFRPERDTTEETYKLRRNTVAKIKQQAHAERWRIRQACAAIIHVLIRVDVFDHIDVKLAEKMAPLVWNYLEKEHMTVHQRCKERTFLQIQPVCTYDAINNVFFTEKHYKAGTPWDLSQVIDCIPYLTCNMEHFWFGFSQMFSSFVNPFMDLILGTIRSILLQQKDPEMQYTDKYVNGKVQGHDYNYFLIDVQHYMVGQQTIMDAVRSLIKKRVSSSGAKIVLSDENIQDAFAWLKQQSLRFDDVSEMAGNPLYVGDIMHSKKKKKKKTVPGGEGPTSTEDDDAANEALLAAQESNMAVIDGESGREDEDETEDNYIVDRFDGIHSKGIHGEAIRELRSGKRVGLEISCKFLNDRLMRPYDDLLEGCIRATIDKDSTTNRRIVLGESLRNEIIMYKKKQYMRPHLLRCIQEKKDGERNTVNVVNDSYVPYSFRFLFEENDELPEIEEERINAKDLEQAVRDDWWKAVGYNPPVGDREERGLKFLCSGEYPMQFHMMEDIAHLRSKRVLRENEEKRADKQAVNKENTTSLEVQKKRPDITGKFTEEKVGKVKVRISRDVSED